MKDSTAFEDFKQCVRAVVTRAHEAEKHASNMRKVAREATVTANQRKILADDLGRIYKRITGKGYWEELNGE